MKNIKNKVFKAFMPKVAPPRPKKEVDAEYTNEAIWLGHKSRILANLNQEANRLQTEIDGHLEKLLKLNQEGMSLPPEITPVPAVTKPVAPPEDTL